MSKQIIFGLVIILLVSSLCAAADQVPTEKDVPVTADVNIPADVNNSGPDGLDGIELPAKDSEEYWVIRSHAVAELTSFFTQKRAEMKEKLVYFKNYIEQIGKTEDMLAADIQGADDPVLRAKAFGIFDQLESKNIAIPKQPLSWEELVEVGMKYVLSEGYSPIDMNDQELVGFKDILKKKEQFCLKVRKETSDLANMIVKGWLYLGTIDKQKAFRLYVIDQKQLEKQAQEEKRNAIKAERKDAKNQQRLKGQDNRWQQKEDRRQNLEQEKLANTRERYQRQRDRYDQYNNGYRY
jgi:hypothetical protein